MKIVTLSNCNICPYMIEEDFRYACSHPGPNCGDYIKTKPSVLYKNKHLLIQPLWCPLPDYTDMRQSLCVPGGVVLCDRHMKTNTNKPPLGLKPRRFHNQDRMISIMDAMTQYMQEFKVIPDEWFDELKELQRCPNGKFTRRIYTST